MKKLYTKFKTIFKLLAAVSLLGSVHVSSFAQTLIFSQDFSASTPITYTANTAVAVTTASGNNTFGTATPSAQLTSLTGIAKTNCGIGLNDATYPGMLYGGGANTTYYWSAMKTTNFSATAPGAIKLVMNATFTVGSSGSNMGVAFAVGSGFTDGLTSTYPATATVNSGFFLHNNSSPKVYNYVDGNNSSTNVSTVLSASAITSGTAYTYTWVINNTGAALNYTDPTGATSSLPNDTWDLWMGNTRYVTAAAAASGGIDLQNLYIGNPIGKNNNLKIEDINVYDISTTCASPTITLGAMPSVVQGTTSASLSYSATTNSPDQYKITWSAAAITAGFANVAYTALPVSPITITVPAAAPGATYTGTLKLNNSGASCESADIPISVTVTVPAVPTITTANTAQTFAACPSGTATQTILVTGTLLSANVTLTLSDVTRYSISAASVPFATANGTGQSITITYNATAAPAGPHAATLTLASAGATSVVINLSGTTSNCYTLTTAVSPIGSGIVTVSPILASYPNGTVVTLTATPSSGYVFDSWTGDAAGAATTTITMNANKSVTANFIVPPPAPTTSSCLTDGFESIVSGSSTALDDQLATGSNMSKTVLIPTGEWVIVDGRLETATKRTGAKALRLSESGVAKVTIPASDNPQSIIFYVAAGTANAGNTLEGIKVELGGVPVTTGYYVDDVATAVNVDGRIVFANTSWHKVEVLLNSSTQQTVTIHAGGTTNGRSRFFYDDVEVKCAAMSLTATPDQTALNYVVGGGPSAMKPVIISGSDMPTTSGTIALSDLGDFEISFNNGTTWQTGAAVTMPFTSSNFVQLAYVRLKTGKALGAYSKTITLSGGGYTKVLPTFDLAGEVVASVTSVDCADGADISKLIGKSAIENNLAVLLIDDITTDSWAGNSRVAVTQKSSVNYVALKNLSSGVKGVLTSPAISLGQYQADKFLISVASVSTTAVPVDIYYSIDNGVTYSLLQQVTTSAIANSFTNFSIDLAAFPIGTSVKFQITPNTSNEVIVSNLILKGIAKKSLETLTPVLTGFQSNVNCPSDPQSFLISGSCMVDNGTINFQSTNYEFASSSAGPWGVAIPYTGSFPSAGMTVYVRQKGAAAADPSVLENVKVYGGGVSLGLGLEVFMMGQIGTPTITAPEVNQKFNFLTANAVPTRRMIELDASNLCTDIAVSSGCGVTVSYCEAGPYAATTTIPKAYTNKRLFFQYTPGAAIVNCPVTLTSGVLSQTIYVNWNGYAAGAKVISAEKGSLTADLIGVPNNVIGTAAVLPTDVVTITSSAGVSGFEFSLGDPEYTDFVDVSSFTANKLGTLYIRKKPATPSGTTETITLTAPGPTSTIFTVTAQ